MSPAYQSLVFLHLLAAFVWLGGLFFLALVGAPVLRREAPSELRPILFRAIGLRFRWVGWTSLAVLGGTGVGILGLRGILRWEVLGDPAWWGTAWGQALAWKLAAVGLMVALTAAHDWLEGPGRRARTAAGESVPRSRRMATLLARGSALAALPLVYWAMRLARGG
jgi:copper resistance protein D